MDVNRSGFSDIHKHLFWILFLLVAVLALGVRVYDISARPFHSDEGVNYHFIGSIIRDGYYRYSHANYHGPAYFYLTFLFTEILGMNDLGMRASAIVMGWGLLPLLLLLLRTESRFFVLTAAALLGFSCSQIFHSRYTIHEPLFVWSSALLGLAVLLWHKTRDPRYHYLAGTALGLLITTKETFIITLFCIFFAFLAIGDFRSVGRDLWRQRFEICGGLLLSACIILLLFSGGLQWPGGIREMFLAVPQWIERNESDVGHFKPFIYYTQLLLGKDVLELLGQTLSTSLTLRKTYLAAAEPQFWFILIIPLLSLTSWKSLRLIFSQEYATGRFFAAWSILSWLVYFWVINETPSLIINSQPLSLLLALSLLVAWILYKIGMSAFWRLFTLAMMFFAAWSILSWLVYFWVINDPPPLIINSQPLSLLLALSLLLPLSLLVAWILYKIGMSAFWRLFTLAMIWKSLRLIFSQEYATGRFFAAWSILSWLVYSCVNYKTPWLIINMTLPLSLLLAWMLCTIGASAFWGLFTLAIWALIQFFLVGAGQTNSYFTFLIYILVIALLALLTLLIKKEWILRYTQLFKALFAVMIICIAARPAYIFNFKIPYGSGHPYCYVHTHAGMMELLTQIKHETEAYGARNVLIATNHYWPLPYYLRTHKGNVGYMKTDDPTNQLKNYDILILDSRSPWQHPPADWVRKYYRLSDVQESHTYFRVE